MERSNTHDVQSDSEDETLGGFIVPDRKRKREEDEQSEDAELSDLEEEAQPIPDEDGPELTKILQEEAQRIAGGSLSTTVVNGRTLRDRTKITAPVDKYWERFGKKNLEKLAVSEHKREMLDDIKAWKKEFTGVRPDFVWPVLSMKDSVEKIEAGHQLVIDTFELELADDLEDTTDEEDLADDDDEELSAEDEDLSQDEDDEEDDEELSEDDENESKDD